MYRIIHSMNNNVALAQNEHGEEVVLIGSGMGFNKKRGDFVVEKNIEKIFRLRTEESKENFVTLLKDIPLDFITVTYDVINSLTQKYDYHVQEYIYVTLTDHVYYCYQSIIHDRYKKSDLPDVSENFPTPYLMAKEAVDIFRERLLYTFPDDEVDRIAYHFMNAEGENNPKERKNLDKRKTILNKVEDELQRKGISRTNSNSHFYDRFMIHLNYFLDYIDRSCGDNKPLLEMEAQMRIAYPEADEISNSIYEIIAHEIDVDLNRSERVYLMIHIQRLLK
ncbi:PRD domain-containing protein [Enterococcus sp.]|uniref:PRD domain-containing protein n=1 Tax=Enterococcus sp. TaxID=35783 RepID=UPI0029078A54|nr:PRD domain-containing protein [Enterococcus sp.]MDU5332849.1 PRD domain-containing protein [Enterococcus sp.]